MKPTATHVKTPVGPFPYPMAPGFAKQLEACKTNEDLFALVEENGFINPDAFTELIAMGLTSEYKKWKSNNKNNENGKR
jgi:hypothetical protein